MKYFIPPVLNLNGSSAETLRADAEAYWTALHAAEVALYQTAPHPRDFQTVDPDVYVAARERFEEVAKVLEGLKEGALQLANDIQDGGLKATPCVWCDSPTASPLEKSCEDCKQREDVLCGCGWGRLAMPVYDIPEVCPQCGAGIGC